ncbi:MAG TPA: hypothetical protein VFE96_09160 [Candidatus Bathyarchaeia archaeon]|jgi:hypothetical protein|nr:hypothetical protein [Candidatus Bathyarchaeia archaeon]
MIQLSGKTLTLGVQSVLNIVLALSLYNEYLHNRYMQDYLASTFPSLSLVLPVGLIATVAVAGGSFTVYSRRHQSPPLSISPRLKTAMLGEPGEKIAVLDTCPFCNVSLKSISENRFQCRKCRRYFKK